MTPKEEKTQYGPYDSPDSTDAPAPEEDFSLEEILAEFGGSLEQTLLRQSGTPDPDKTPPEPRPGEPARPADIPAPTPEIPDPALPKAPCPVSLEDVVGSTVDAVMEGAAPPLSPRRGLFSRQRLEETGEPLYCREPEEEEATPEAAEPELSEEASALRAKFRRRRGFLPAAAVFALVPTLLLGLERQGIPVPGWAGDSRRQSLILLVCLAAVALLCHQVFARGVRMLLRGRCTADFLISAAALAAAADCGIRLLSTQRSDAMPYAAVSCLSMVFALWGLRREELGRWETFRSASVDEDPPYLVTETAQGACKQRGAAAGFYTAAVQDNAAVLWQAAVLPLILACSMVFAGLSSLGQSRQHDFFLNWSAILAAGATFSLPLCWGLPYARLARHLQKAGCAVAGWAGAESISRKRKMILTDTDLFPPGTAQLNGVRVFGEEVKTAAAYAASMARAAGSGLERLFSDLLCREGGCYEELSDFSFYDQGGWSGIFHGATVLMGTASFMRKMDIRLPGDVNLKTGLFLAVDGHLVAVFAVKYDASENVDFALRMMERSRVTPILASRDPNIVPELLRRRFHKSVKASFPDISSRVALSEAELDRGRPRALIFREGLLPYAETVVGSLRLCKSVRRSVILSLLGSAAGTLLSFYLVSLGQYALLTPLALELFLLLWTLPVLLIVDWAGRY